MKRFQVSVPHVVIGLAALAMTATTMALAVVVPATSAPRTSVDIVPGRIEVVAFRGAATAPRAIVGAATTRHHG